MRILGCFSEADETTCVLRATPVHLVQSAAHAHRAQEAEQVFRRHGGEDEEVDAKELVAILNETFTKGFEPHSRSRLAI